MSFEDKSFIVLKNSIPFLLSKDSYINLGNQTLMVSGLGAIITFLKNLGIIREDFNIFLINKKDKELVFKRIIQAYFKKHLRDEYVFLTFSKDYEFDFNNPNFFRLIKDIITSIENVSNANNITEEDLRNRVNEVRDSIFKPKEEVIDKESFLKGLEIIRNEDYYAVITALNSMIKQVFGKSYPQIVFESRKNKYLFSNFVKTYVRFLPSLTDEEISQKIISDLRNLDERLWFIYEIYFEIFVELSENYNYKINASLEEVKAEILEVLTNLPENTNDKPENVFRTALEERIRSKRPAATSLFEQAEQVEEAFDEISK
ncbi:MAG: hypothetical protein JW791_01965 [Nanoarchaeota archaeon]|nr:hypothetical protein [Nanoarchaeota archaeon]